MIHVPFNLVNVDEKEKSFLNDALDRGRLEGGNNYYSGLCEQFLEELILGSKCRLVTSCTSALEIAAILLELGPGDEVIVPSYTFVSTANAIALRGATPVFVDVLDGCFNIDPREVEAKITSRTRAIFVVHYAGFIAEMHEIGDIAEKYRIPIVEDAAQAIFSEFSGRQAGSFGAVAAFSFHNTKNLSCGEGGCVVVNDDRFIERMEVIREKGTNREQFVNGLVEKYTWVDIGSSYVLSELCSSFLYGQLLRGREITGRRLKIFDRYQSELSFIAHRYGFGMSGSEGRPDSKGNGHMFYLVMSSDTERRQFIDFMGSKGITCVSHYVPLHSSPYIKKRFGLQSGSFKNTDKAGDCLVRLPLWCGVEEFQENILQATEDYFKRYR